jgi:hypothetical protein
MTTWNTKHFLILLVYVVNDRTEANYIDEFMNENHAL